jgi:hypothetical protein
MSNQRRSKLMVLSSVLLGLAPKCPICFLAYFGIFGVATASVSVYRVWLPHLTAVWLAITVGMLVFQRGGQRRYGPALLGFLAALAVFVGRFILNDQTVVYTGIVALMGAAVWRARSRRPTSSEFCPQCEQLPLLDDKEPGVARPGELLTNGGQLKEATIYTAQIRL